MTLVFVNTRIAGREHLPAIVDGERGGAADRAASRLARRRRSGARSRRRWRPERCAPWSATSTLDLGIDWGDVDLVIHVGAPKGSSRLLQRIGRANHRLDEPSRALLVPANRFEVLECEAARAAVIEGAQDTEPPARHKLDVLCQHILGVACAGPFHPDYPLWRGAPQLRPIASSTGRMFDQAVDFVSTGGYALKGYERYAKLRPLGDGRLRLAHPRLAQQYRLNVGTIVEAEMLKVRLVRRRRGGLEGASALVAAGGCWARSRNISSSSCGRATPSCSPARCCASRGWTRLQCAGQPRRSAADPKMPSYVGGKFPLSTYLAGRVRGMLADPRAGAACRRRCATG